MFMHIYKLTDDKWHIYSRGHRTDCGMNLSQVIEEKIIGKGREECEHDPHVSTVCPKCFNFLPEFNCPLV